jgi:Ca-activated chloride channel homolog
MVRVRLHNISLAALLLSLILPAGAQQPSEVPPPGIRVAADGVFVRVQVKDPLNRYITGLGQESFKLYENGVQQTIRSFAQLSAPLQMGIIFDNRVSLANQGEAGTPDYTRWLNPGSAEVVGTSIARWLNSERPDDDIFLIVFDRERAQLAVFRGDNRSPDVTPLNQPGARTALSFAISESMDQFRKDKSEKRALILITDGIEQGSPSTASDLEKLRKQSDVQIFTITGQPRSMKNPAVFPALPGVRSFILSERTELGYYLNLIHDEMANQYVLGYSPANKSKDGKWRKILVKLDQPKGAPELVVRASAGYYPAGK